MKTQGFSGFLFFTGYKMATSAKFFVAVIFFSHRIKLIGYFGLLVRIQVAVGVHGGLYPFVSQAFCNQKRCAAHINQQTGMGMPLRYNYDKPEKPRISRVFGYLARFFILFQTEKSSREVVIS